MKGGDHHSIDIGLRKQVITHFINGVKSNLVGGTPLEFFEKQDKRKTGYLSRKAFVNVSEEPLFKK